MRRYVPNRDGGGQINWFIYLCIINILGGVEGGGMCRGGGSLVLI